MGDKTSSIGLSYVNVRSGLLRADYVSSDVHSKQLSNKISCGKPCL